MITELVGLRNTSTIFYGVGGGLGHRYVAPMHKARVHALDGTALQGLCRGTLCREPDDPRCTAAGAGRSSIWHCRSRCSWLSARPTLFDQ